ncbi:MAG: low molecular weight protein arginine phosphatase, partial [Verrucomicrobia bacterium]|nr:low molecular weight protein arginine phosphatase [Verrucomicrobiota bacterium]
MKTILFVCTGNVCRSPMAEGWARHLLAGRDDIRVMSAGLGTADGQPPSDYAVDAMRQLGVDISGHRSQRLTPELADEADFIFGLAQSHVDSVIMNCPEAADRVYLLREFDESAPPSQRDILDPIGQPLENYL